jgi:hypothetical protein
VIRFPDFTPDRSGYALDSSNYIRNCLPVADGWGPLPDLIAVSDPLPAACRGAISVRTSAGAWSTFAGTATKLYHLNSGTSPYSFDDYTRLAGGDYAVPSTDRWCFAVVGDTLIATNIVDDVQFIDVGSGVNFAALAGSPPKAKYCATVNEYLVLGHLANLPNVVQWSAFGDIESWTRGVGGAWRQELATGGEVQGVFPIEGGAVVFQRNAIQSMSYTADAASFNFDVINPARGAIAPLCVVAIGAGQYFYLAEDGFYIFTLGAGDEPVGANRVDNWFLGSDGSDLSAEVDRDNLGDVRGFLDPFRKGVWIQYPKSAGGYGLLYLNYQLTGLDGRRGRWSYFDNDVEEIVALATPGVTIDGLASLYASIDAIDVPFDSRLLSGGKPTIGGFTTDHELAYFSGQNRAATLRTPKAQLVPGYRALLQEVSLLGDLDPEDVTISVGTSDRRGGTTVWGTSTSPEADNSGIFKPDPQECDGRFHEVQVDIDGGVIWNSITGIDDQESQWVQTGKI